jgi:ACS family hexuronate transporter-like MFS transporter
METRVESQLDTATATATEAGRARSFGHYRWLVCSLLFFATTVNYVDRQILSLVKPMLDSELHWNNAQFGQVNAAFQAAYAVGLLGFGKFIDQFGTKLGYGVSIAAWSLAAMGHAAASSVGGFALARVALGLGEGGNFPSAIKAVAVWFPRRERAFATALFNSGANVGAILAPATVPWLAATGGWRLPFVTAGAAGFVWLLLWRFLYDVPERIAAVSPRELTQIRSDADLPERGGHVRWTQLLKLKPAWAFIVAKFLTDPVWWFFLIWLPDFFKKTRGLDIKSSWIHLVTIYLIVTVLSIAGGWVTGYWVRRGLTATRARKRGMLLFACLVVPVIAVTTASDWGAVLLIGLAGAAHQAWSANLYTSVSDTFPKRAVASVVGIGGMAGSLGGIAFPLYAGELLDRFEASGNITAGYGVLFGICSSAYLIAFAIHHVLAPKFEPLEMADS